MVDILLVDDDLENRFAVQATIKASRLQDIVVWETDTAEKGLAMVKQKRPAIVLTDVSLPDMDGIDFGKKVLASFPDTSVLIVTQLQMFETVQECINAGFSAYLLKPVDKSQLLQIFERLLTSQQLRHAILPLANSKRLPSELLEADIGNPIETAIKYIQLKYYEPVALKVVADFVYMSPSHFSRIFKEQTGMTFVEYLTEYRLEKSKNLLRTTSLTLDVIANQTGFSSSAYFATTFKRKENQTPSEYRNRFSDFGS